MMSTKTGVRVKNVFDVCCDRIQVNILKLVDAEEAGLEERSIAYLQQRGRQLRRNWRAYYVKWCAGGWCLLSGKRWKAPREFWRSGV